MPKFKGALRDSTAVSIFVVILVKLTNTAFVNSTNITTNIETAVLSTYIRPTLCQNQKGTPYDRYEFIHQRIKQLKLDTFSN